MKKVLILIGAAVISVLCLPSALALGADQKDGYFPIEITGNNWSGIASHIYNVYPGFQSRTHPDGTWNDPAVLGADAFNYDNSEDNSQSVTQAVNEETGTGAMPVSVSAHRGYLTSTHKCSVCHGSRESSGTPELANLKAGYEVCDWCHGAGDASSFIVQTDNDREFSKEYGVGHSMGYNLSSGKWKAPDDTNPAFMPAYWLGGFSCFDCHSAHANPLRLLGYSNANDTTYTVYNPGYENPTAPMDAGYPAGSWLLLKDPDREVDSGTGEEIPDKDAGVKTVAVTREKLQKTVVNKQPIDWDKPMGFYDKSSGTMKNGFHVSEFCIDCHDGDGGLATQKVALFSEDIAAKNHDNPNPYDFGTSHDSNGRDTGTHYAYNPEDGKNNGPTCRMCHRGSSGCNICHNSFTRLKGKQEWPRSPLVVRSPGNFAPELTANWNDPSPIFVLPEDWQANRDISVSPSCFDSGFNWPHKTLGWKMLKDDLFGIDVDGETPIAPGDSRKLLNQPNQPNKLNQSAAATMATDSPTTALSLDPLLSTSTTDTTMPAGDMDSVCLDCHNPYIWNPQNENDLILKGLP